MKSKRSRVILLLVVLTALVVGGAYVFLHRFEESTDDAAIDGRTVVISAKVSGYVKTLNINDNQMVKAGDVLLEIDPTDYAIRRDRAQAFLDAAQAAAAASQSNMESTNVSANSNLTAAQAQVNAAEANEAKAMSDLKRMQTLSNEARSQQQLDQAIAVEKSTRSSLEDARAKLLTAGTAPHTIAAAQSTYDQLQAQVNQAMADLAQAENDLANTKLLAPMDGRITKRGVERGNYVQPGQPLSSLVGTDLWVTADFKETQLKHMHAGQPVMIEIDAFPAQKFHGKVDSIQSGTGAYFSAFPPENATGNFVKIVQRVPVKIVFDPAPDANLAIGPGMSAVPVVDTEN